VHASVRTQARMGGDLKRIQVLWGEVRDSLWFLPGLLTLAGAALAVATVALNDRIIDALGIQPDEIWWLFGAGSDGARAILSAITGSLIQVTGVVFSVTIIALQLASSQFTPRVLRTFTSDRANQYVLGVFIGTFTYALLVQRAVRSSGDDSDGFVPALAITLAILLTLVSIGFLIFFINHATRSIQASVIISNVAEDTRTIGERIFARERGDTNVRAGAARAGTADSAGRVSGTGPERNTSGDVTRPAAADTEGADGPPRRVGEARAGYVQAIDEDRLFELADSHDLHVRVEQGIGDFVLPGQALLAAWPERRVDDTLAEALSETFVLGLERTPRQDFELGLVELVDIAVKALSPSINDPTTAMMALDRLAELLVVIGRHERLDCERRNGDGRLCLIVRRPSFERAVTLTFDQVRHHGGGDPAVMGHMLDLLGDIGELICAGHRPRVERAIETARAHVERAIPEPADRLRVLAAADKSLDRIAEAAA
jgi:uncharacterized membrane protein